MTDPRPTAQTYSAHPMTSPDGPAAFQTEALLRHEIGTDELMGMLHEALVPFAGPMNDKCGVGMIIHDMPDGRRRVEIIGLVCDVEGTA